MALWENAQHSHLQSWGCLGGDDRLSPSHVSATVASMPKAPRAGLMVRSTEGLAPRAGSGGVGGPQWSWWGKGPLPRQQCLPQPGSGHNASAKVFSCPSEAPPPSAHLPSTPQTFTAEFSKQTSASGVCSGGRKSHSGLSFPRGRKGLGQQHCSLAQRTAMRHQAAHEVGYSDPSPLREKDACVPEGRGRRDKGFCCSDC